VEKEMINRIIIAKLFLFAGMFSMVSGCALFIAERVVGVDPVYGFNLIIFGLPMMVLGVCILTTCEEKKGD
jgi:hypothetical protein